MSSRTRIWTVTLMALLAAPLLGQGGRKKPKGVYLTVDEALVLAFPDCDVERESIYLDKDERKRIARLSGQDCERGVLHAWRARKKDGKRQLVGTAWFDTHKVRSMKETLMVVVDPAGKVSRIEVLAFAEPKRYLPRAKWFAQFVGRSLDEGLQTKNAVRGISGATLSCNAANDCVRRLLAEHTVAGEQAARRAAEEARKREEAKKKPQPKPVPIPVPVPSGGGSEAGA